MGTKETRLQRGRRRGCELTRAAVTQLRDARITGGVSQATLARELGITQASVSFMEANKLENVSLTRIAEVASILGLEPALTFHPIGLPLRDKGHEALIDRVRARISGAWQVTREAPFPADGDPRSWDLLLRHPTQRYLVGIEAETRVRDLQVLVRRMRQRAVEGGVDVLVIVLSDSATNRAVIGRLREALGEGFSASPAQILAALAAGARLPGSGVLLL